MQAVSPTKGEKLLMKWDLSLFIQTLVLFYYVMPRGAVFKANHVLHLISTGASTGAL